MDPSVISCLDCNNVVRSLYPRSFLPSAPNPDPLFFPECPDCSLCSIVGERSKRRVISEIFPLLRENFPPQYIQFSFRCSLAKDCPGTAYALKQPYNCMVATGTCEGCVRCRSSSISHVMTLLYDLSSIPFFDQCEVMDNSLLKEKEREEGREKE